VDPRRDLYNQLRGQGVSQDEAARQVRERFAPAQQPTEPSVDQGRGMYNELRSQGVSQDDAERRVRENFSPTPPAPAPPPPPQPMAAEPEPAPQRSRPLEKAARLYRGITGAPYDLASGVAQGVSEFGQSWVGLGELADPEGKTPVGRSSSAARQMIEYEDPDLGFFGKIGRVAGRLAPEAAAGLGAGALVRTGLRRYAPRLGAPVIAALESPSRAVRGAATMGVSAPFDVAQGLQYGEGMLLPGRAGSVAENLAISYGAGAAFPAARRAAAVAEEVPAGPITDPARLIAAPRPRTTPAGGQVTPESVQARLDRAAEEARAARDVAPSTPTDVVRVEPNVRVEVDPGSGMRTTYQWNEKEGRWVVRDRSRARRVSEAMRIVRDAEEAAALRKRLGGAGPQIPSIEAARQIEAAAESGRRLREAQPRPLIERPSVAGDPVFSAPRAEPPSAEFFTRRPEPATPRAAARPAAEAVAPAPAARATEEAVAPAPTVSETPPSAARAAREVSEDLDFDAARQRITEPVAPYPADFPVKPRTDDEWRRYYRRFTNDPDEVVRLEGQRKAGEIQTRQGTQRISDNMAIADDIAKKYPDLAFLKADQTLTGPELVALRSQYEGVKETGTELSKFMDTLSPDDPRLAQFSELRGALARRATAMFERLSRDSSQQGRNLRLLKEVKESSNNPTDWLYYAQTLAGRELDMNEVKTLMKLVDEGKTVEASKLVGKLRQSTFFDRTGEIYQSFLLSGFMRPVRDLFSSAVNLADAGLERTVANALDSIVSQISGSDRQIVFGARRFWPELQKAAKRGGDVAVAIGRGKGDPEILARAAKRYDFARESIQKNPVARIFTTWTKRSIAMPDATIYEMAHAMSLYEMGEVFVRNSDVVKSGTVKVGSQPYREMVSKFMADPPMEMDAIARDMATQVVFQNSTTMGNAFKFLNRSELPIVRLFGKLLVPFRQTPAAITTQTLKGITAPARAVYNVGEALDLFRKSPDAIDQVARNVGIDKARRNAINQTAKASVAWGWIGLGYVMADKDLMTGLYPYDDRERRRWELDGRLEAAIKWGGKWVPTLGLLGPQAQLMAIGAQLRSAVDNPKGFFRDVFSPSGATEIAKAAGGVTLQTPSLQGIESLFGLYKQALDDDGFKQAGTRVARSYVGGWVPQFVQQIARATDTSPEGAIIQREIRDPDSGVRTAVNAFIQGIPGLRQTLPARIDMFGEERAATVGGVTSILSPARLGIPADDPVARELWRTNASIPRTMRRKNESAEEHRDRAIALGTYTRQALGQVIASPEYREIARMPVGDVRRELLEYTRAAGFSRDDIEAIEKMSDSQIRARLQGMLLEDVITRVRTNVGRGFADPTGGRGGNVVRTLTR
jgi:hypothetical protein